VYVTYSFNMWVVDDAENDSLDEVWDDLSICWRICFLLSDGDLWEHNVNMGGGGGGSSGCRGIRVVVAVMMVLVK